MKCVKCGNELSDDANFCRKCGEPVKREESPKSLDLTDNIDVSKVKLDTKQETYQDDDTIEIRPSKDLSNKELSAMMELTHYTSNSKEEKNDNESHETSEQSSSDKIKKILEELEPEESSSKGIDELDEPTVLIPKDLISSYEKNKAKIEENYKLEETKISKPEISVEKETKEEVKEIPSKEISQPVEEVVNQIKDTETKPAPVEEKVELPKEDKPEPKEETKKIELDKDKEEINVSLEDDYQPKQNKSSHVGTWIFGILFILAVAFCIYLWVVLNESNKQYKKIKNEKEVLEQQVENKDTDNQSSEKVETTKDDNYVTFDGYKFSLSNVNNYNISNDNLVLNYKDSVVVANIDTDTKYSEVKLSKESYRKLLVSNEYTVNSYGTKVIDEREYVVYQVTDSENKKSLVAYTNLDETSTIAFIISNTDNTVDYDSLDITNKLLSSVEEDNSYKNYDLDMFSLE